MELLGRYGLRSRPRASRARGFPPFSRDSLATLSVSGGDGNKRLAVFRIAGSGAFPP